MFYKVKPADTLSKIAKAHQTTVAMILAFNKSIKNPNHLYVGQVIHLPNTEDVPVEAIKIATTTAEQLIERAKTAIGKGISYKPGAGYYLMMNS